MISEERVSPVSAVLGIPVANLALDDNRRQSKLKAVKQKSQQHQQHQQQDQQDQKQLQRLESLAQERSSPSQSLLKGNRRQLNPVNLYSHSLPSSTSTTPIPSSSIRDNRILPASSSIGTLSHQIRHHQQTINNSSATISSYQGYKRSNLIAWEISVAEFLQRIDKSETNRPASRQLIDQCMQLLKEYALNSGVYQFQLSALLEEVNHLIFSSCRCEASSCVDGFATFFQHMSHLQIERQTILAARENAEHMCQIRTIELNAANEQIRTDKALLASKSLELEAARKKFHKQSNEESKRTDELLKELDESEMECDMYRAKVNDLLEIIGRVTQRMRVLETAVHMPSNKTDELKKEVIKSWDQIQELKSKYSENVSKDEMKEVNNQLAATKEELTALKSKYFAMIAAQLNRNKDSSGESNGNLLIENLVNSNTGTVTGTAAGSAVNSNNSNIDNVLTSNGENGLAFLNHFIEHDNKPNLNNGNIINNRDSGNNIITPSIVINGAIESVTPTSISSTPAAANSNGGNEISSSAAALNGKEKEKEKGWNGEIKFDLEKYKNEYSKSVNAMQVFENHQPLLQIQVTAPSQTNDNVQVAENDNLKKQIEKLQEQLREKDKQINELNSSAVTLMSKTDDNDNKHMHDDDDHHLREKTAIPQPSTINSMMKEEEEEEEEEASEKLPPFVLSVPEWDTAYFQQNEVSNNAKSFTTTTTTTYQPSSINSNQVPVNFRVKEKDQIQTSSQYSHSNDNNDNNNNNDSKLKLNFNASEWLPSFNNRDIPSQIEIQVDTPPILGSVVLVPDWDTVYKSNNVHNKSSSLQVQRNHPQKHLDNT